LPKPKINYKRRFNKLAQIVVREQKPMGLTYADIELISTDDIALVRGGFLPSDQIRQANVTALVDSGALMLSISRTVRDQLGLFTVGDCDVEVADGSIISVDLVGPVEVRFENRRTITEAVVMPEGDEVLLGVIPMEGLDVLIDPKQQKLVVNPKSPGKARVFLKGIPPSK
jgi:clan AA aspartic protease